MHRGVEMISDVKRVWMIFPMMMGLFLLACQPIIENPEIREQVDKPPVTNERPESVSTKMPSPRPIMTSPPATATIHSSPTPKRIVAVAAPERWAAALSESLDRLNSLDGDWKWQQVTDAADISIESGNHGHPFTATTTALTVNFSSVLESVTSEEALRIISIGDDRISVMDWSDVSPERRSLRIDGLSPGEQGYPLQQNWSIISDPDFDDAANELAADLRNSTQADAVVKLAAVGDLMLDRALGYAISQGQIEYPFAHVATILSGADLSIGNLESALGTLGQPANKSYTFRAPAAAAESLAVAGFDLVSLANNHALDYGEEALLEGIDLLKRQEISTIGAGRNISIAREPVFFETNGLNIAFLGYVDVPVEVSGFDTRSWQATDDTPGLAWAHLDDISEDVSTADKDADLIVVVLHSGYEYIETPSEPQRLAAKTAIDAGADLVIGHHTHLLQGIEFYDGGVIAYGLGNFAFEIDGDPSTAVLNLWLDNDGVREIEIIPAIIQFGGQTRLASAFEAASIKERIYFLSGLLNSP